MIPTLDQFVPGFQFELYAGQGKWIPFTYDEKRFSKAFIAKGLTEGREYIRVMDYTRKTQNSHG